MSTYVLLIVKTFVLVSSKQLGPIITSTAVEMD